MKKASVAAIACFGLMYGQTANESDPNYNAAKDPCYDLKSQLASELYNLEQYKQNAKEELANYEHFSKTKRDMEGAALDGLWSAASDLYYVGRCVTGDASAVPVAVLKLTRAQLNIALIVMPGLSGVDLAPNALKHYNYWAGEAKKSAERILALQERLKDCCSPYLKPPADTNPPPNNPGGGGGGGPITTGSSGSSTGAAPGGTGGTTGLGQGNSQPRNGYFDITRPGRPFGSNPTAGPGGDGPQYGYYGHPGYRPALASNLTGFGYLHIQGVIVNLADLERHCDETYDLYSVPNHPPGSPSKTKVSVCFKDLSYSAGYVVEEINQRTRRGHSPEMIRQIESLLPTATQLRTRTTTRRAAVDKALLSR